MSGRWRGMAAADLPAVHALSERIHPELPEGPEIFANRLAVYPAGCLVLDAEGTIAGYAVSHPIRRDAPPPLATLLPAIAPDADTFYIHDLVVAPERRGRGEAALGVRRLLLLAEAYPQAALISVYGTGGFWGRFGFDVVAQDRMRDKLTPYGPDAVYMIRNTKVR